MKPGSILAVVSALVPAASAFWRMECRGNLGLARIDPLVSPGEIAQHVHTLEGSSGLSESTTYEDLRSGDCTSCAVTQDLSAYWTPALYFRHENGSYELVPQAGGMLAYYKLNSPPGQPGNITAFPNGFRMIAGDNSRRSWSVPGFDYKKPDPPQSSWVVLNQISQTALEQRALGFNCLNYAGTNEPALYRHYLPDKEFLDARCPNGVRFELQFPSCWNGRDIDSDNHKDHVAYADLVQQGNCPSGHPITLPALFYETIWETNVFADYPGEFVIANGDVQGFGYHGDFIMGWDETLLQQAVDTCTNPSGLIEDCPLFDIQDLAAQNQCSMSLPSAIASEKVDGTVGTELPGGVAITYGPGSATLASVTSQATTAVTSPTVSHSSSTTIADEATYSHATMPTESGSPETSMMAPATTAETASMHRSAHHEAVQPSPDTTKAPVPTTSDGLPAFSTQYISDGEGFTEIVYVEDVVYVTEFVEATATETVTPTFGLQARHWHHVHARAAHHGRKAHH